VKNRQIWPLLFHRSLGLSNHSPSTDGFGASLPSKYPEQFRMESNIYLKLVFYRLTEIRYPLSKKTSGRDPGHHRGPQGPKSPISERNLQSRGRIYSEPASMDGTSDAAPKMPRSARPKCRSLDRQMLIRPSRASSPGRHTRLKRCSPLAQRASIRLRIPHRPNIDSFRCFFSWTSRCGSAPSGYDLRSAVSGHLRSVEDMCRFLNGLSYSGRSGGR
jgi:hypothetical protein